VAPSLTRHCLQPAAAAVSGLAPAGPELRRKPRELAFAGRRVVIDAPLSVREAGFSCTPRLAELLTSKDGKPGGTAWAWAREDIAQSVDILVVDEAGQMSLAIAQATTNLVLPGDPNQLEQPQKGSHPDGADVSALEHLLDRRPTMPPARGLFLHTLGASIPRFARSRQRCSTQANSPLMTAWNASRSAERWR
jgi:hypothetical protein